MSILRTGHGQSSSKKIQFSSKRKKLKMGNLHSPTASSLKYLPLSWYSRNPPPSCRAPWPQRRSSPAPKGWRGGKHPQSSPGPAEASLFPERPPTPIFVLSASDPVDKQKICLQGPTVKVEHAFNSSLGEALKAKAKGLFPLPFLPPGETGIIHEFNSCTVLSLTTLATPKPRGSPRR